MAYEKYIKKDGKLYGPYLYHSKRVDGKVVSEYHGQNDNNYSKFFLMFFLVAALGSVVYFMGFNHGTTGNAVLDLNANYLEGKSLEGTVALNLNQGELIPATSKVVLDNNGKTSEYNLEDLVSDQTVEGNFYLQNSQISGTGLGFGMPGERQTPRDVSFVLSVLTPAEDPNTEVETEVSGIVSADKAFVYDLQDGQRAELKPRSAEVGGKVIDDSEITISTEGNQVTVATEYSEKETGFGAEFLGAKQQTISIDLTKLNFVPEKGNLKLSIVDSGIEMLVVNTPVEEGKVQAEIPEQEPQAQEQSKEIDNNSMQEPVVTPMASVELTTVERATLTDKFGNVTVQTSEAKIKNGFVIIRFEIGDYWIENSYDAKLSNFALKAMVDMDRTKWLKDLASEISNTEVEEKNLPGFAGSSSI